MCRRNDLCLWEEGHLPDPPHVQSLRSLAIFSYKNIIIMLFRSVFYIRNSHKIQLKIFMCVKELVFETKNVKYSLHRVHGGLLSDPPAARSLRFLAAEEL